MKSKQIPEKLQSKTAHEKVTRKMKENQMPKKPRQRLKTEKHKRIIINSSDSISDDQPILESPPEVSDEENQFVEYTENYYSTNSQDDWIRRQMCLCWLHESCTTSCNRCGRQEKSALIKNKLKE
ncbi:hypothetical protein JTB14_024962 [Gonioctena quinquepunctata]|nr:hypothetical protein JTB14_024962 [Gonioctena quinquepunctata]